MDTKKLKSFDQNLIDLLKDAHKWEYTEINDNKEKKPTEETKTILYAFSMGFSSPICCMYYSVSEWLEF